MRDAFLKQLEELHKMLAEMGLLCEKMIDGTYEALMNMDREVAAKILQDDANVDLKERDIESKCLKLLLEQQPVASDLRKISSALKMITDLERIGDQAGDIAEIIKTTDLLEPVKARWQKPLRPWSARALRASQTRTSRRQRKSSPTMT